METKSLLDLLMQPPPTAFGRTMEEGPLSSNVEDRRNEGILALLLREHRLGSLYGRNPADWKPAYPAQEGWGPSLVEPPAWSKDGWLFDGKPK